MGEWFLWANPGSWANLGNVFKEEASAVCLCWNTFHCFVLGIWGWYEFLKCIKSKCELCTCLVVGKGRTSVRVQRDKGQGCVLAGKGRGWGITLGRRSEGMQGVSCGFSVDMYFSPWCVSTGRGGTRHSSLSGDVLDPSPHLLSWKLGSGRFLLLWAQPFPVSIPELEDLSHLKRWDLFFSPCVW